MESHHDPGGALYIELVADKELEEAQPDQASI